MSANVSRRGVTCANVHNLKLLEVGGQKSLSPRCRTEVVRLRNEDHGKKKNVHELYRSYYLQTDAEPYTKRVCLYLGTNCTDVIVDRRRYY